MVEEYRQFEHYDERANTLLKVRIIDTPGFGNRVNHKHSVRPITKYVSRCRTRRFHSEMFVVGDDHRRGASRGRGRNRKRNHSVTDGEDDADHTGDEDPLVHVCLYFLSPGRFLEIDRHFLQRVHNEVAIVPIIAKADTMTDVEIAQYRSELKDTFKRYGICTYDLDVVAEDGVGAAGGESSAMASRNNTYRRGRRCGEALAIVSRNGVYPWGESKSYDADHSDLGLVLNLLLSKHTETFIDLAKHKYCVYRAGRIRKKKVRDCVKMAMEGLFVLQSFGVFQKINRMSNSDCSDGDGILPLQRIHQYMQYLAQLIFRSLGRAQGRDDDINTNDDNKDEKESTVLIGSTNNDTASTTDNGNDSDDDSRNDGDNDNKYEAPTKPTINFHRNHALLGPFGIPN